ncbi:hypothetical protein AOXY_G29686 [Acipenser oxyrinchus oxyrinchus]|uniref:THAP-type domain-containing protein n=1 Tax=Acipenser oxyrinchus oxyrinchus TaxID=40147 RepID=A0AAD8CMG0_ACIOX|nr:hypothetical protein AOXY_G29686 [Acipenser oxyrinchus oxyrinchus]
MPVSCAAINCSELRNEDTLRRGITFHGFPKSQLRKNQWRIAVRRQTPDNKLWEPTKYTVLCSKHFKAEMFDRTGQTVRLRDHAVPTEFDFGVIKKNVEEAEPLSKSAMKKRRRRKGKGSRTRKCPPHTASARGIGDLVLAAELVELVGQSQGGLRLGFDNDHRGYSLPPDPQALTRLARIFAQNLHRQEQRLSELQGALESKEALYAQSKECWEWEQHTLTMAHEARVDAMENEAARLRLEGSVRQRELTRARSEAASSAETVLQLGAQLSERKARPRRCVLSARGLSQEPKWLRFFTGFESYGKFTAFLEFLRSGDGGGLCWNRAANQEGEGGASGTEGGAVEEEEEEVVSDGLVEVLGEDVFVDAQAPVSDSVTQTEGLSVGGANSSEGGAFPGRVYSRRTEGGAPNLLSPEDQLLLVLTRLRLGLLLQDLSFRFKVAESTVSRIWVHWMELLQKRLQQIPVRCSLRYIDSFRPKHSVLLGQGSPLTVLECADLLFDVPARASAALPSPPPALPRPVPPPGLRPGLPQWLPGLRQHPAAGRVGGGADPRAGPAPLPVPLGGPGPRGPLQGGAERAEPD